MLKRWLLVQLAGGAVAIAGLLLMTYVLAEAARAGGKPLLSVPSGVLLAGLAVHVAGRIGARLHR